MRGSQQDRRAHTHADVWTFPSGVQKRKKKKEGTLVLEQESLLSVQAHHCHPSLSTPLSVPGSLPCPAPVPPPEAFSFRKKSPRDKALPKPFHWEPDAEEEPVSELTYRPVGAGRVHALQHRLALPGPSTPHLLSVLRLCCSQSKYASMNPRRQGFLLVFFTALVSILYLMSEK